MRWAHIVPCSCHSFSLLCDCCCCSVTKSCPILCDPWTEAHQTSLSFTISWGLLKLMSIYLVISFNHFILCHLLPLLPSIFSSIRLFSWVFTSGGQSIGASASASVLPMNVHGWFPLGLTGLISLLSKGLSRVFSSTTIQKYLMWYYKNIPWFIYLLVMDILVLFQFGDIMN